MVKIRLLLVNYNNSSLVGELLKRSYNVSIANTRVHRLNLSISDKFDLIYFAKFAWSRCDDIDILFAKDKKNMIYGLHGLPVSFRPYRPLNYVDMTISFTKLLYLKLAKPKIGIHALNTDDYRRLKAFKFRCYYSPLGVDTKFFKPGAKKEDFTVVFVSPRFQKGADMLPRILPMVLKKASNIKFVLTGEGFLSNYFEVLKDHFSSNVEVCERLPQDEFVKLFSSSHLLLFPSRWETFGLVVLEALSSGMPVVCYDIVGAARDIVKKYSMGYVAKPYHTEEVAKGVLHYYSLWRDRRERYNELSDKCRDIALRYDWSIVAGYFDLMFKKTLSYRGQL